MSDNILAEYKAIDLVKDDFILITGVKVDVDLSRVLCRH